MGLLIGGQAVAAACTAAFQKHKKAGGRAPAAKSSGQRAAPRAASGGGGGKANSEKLARMEKMKRMSLKRHEGGHKTVSKLTDDWFAPDMVRGQIGRAAHLPVIGSLPSPHSGILWANSGLPSRWPHPCPQMAFVTYTGRGTAALGRARGVPMLTGVVHAVCSILRLVWGLQSRDAVNSKLKSARVGDFFIRESSSQVGDYAISVQTGKNIWTGLVIHSNDGFQLGNKGNTLFNELTDLVRLSSIQLLGTPSPPLFFRKCDKENF